MRITEHVETLELSMDMAGRRSSIHPVLLWDDGEGATLIDTGMPGQLELIRERMNAVHVPLESIRRIILTHQDIDHIGGARALADTIGAEVLAHEGDRPYIQGEKKLLKMSGERLEAVLAALPEGERERVRRIFSDPPTAEVTRLIRDGEELPIHGGIVVIHTPGHTPGHVSLYLKKHRLLVSGDALRVEDGVLVGPNPGATPDMETAVASLRKLDPFEIDRVICYHGGLSPVAASARIRELARG